MCIVILMTLNFYITTSVPYYEKQVMVLNFYFTTFIPYYEKQVMVLCSCHTLISSGDHPLLGCDPRLTTSRYLAPIVRQFVKFQDMPEAKRKAL